MSCHILAPTSCQPPKVFRLQCNSRFRANTHTVRATTLPVPGDCNMTRDRAEDNTVAFWDYQFLFTSQRLEVADPIKLRLIDGTLPRDFPLGMYYLTGPGLFIDDYGSTVHPLDGHGYVRAFEIDGSKGEVRFSAKYVKTEAQMEECDPASGSWKFTHRGPFSVLKGSNMVANTKVMKNVANTSILKWSGRLFCLWEGGTPYEIDPATLDTIGNFNMLINENECIEEKASIGRSRGWDVVAHLLKPILYGLFKMPPKRLLSHYKIDIHRSRLIIMTCDAEDMLLPQSHCTFYEFDEYFNILQKREFNLPDHLMIHDWAFTDSHYILFANRVGIDMLGSMAAMSGLAPMISALSVNSSKPTSPLYLLPRFSDISMNSTSYKYWREPIEVPQLWLLHVANAFEDIDDHGNLTIKIDASTCAYKWFNFQKMFGYNWHRDVLDPSTMNSNEGKEHLLPHLVEVSIKLPRERNEPECSVTRLNEWDKSSDFPTINPRHSGYRHRYIYYATSSSSCETLPYFPFDTVAKMDTTSKIVQAWSPGSRRFVGEPMFVSRGSNAEDDGYILTVEYAVSHRKCNLLVLDAKRLGEANPLIARFEVPKSLTFPLGFHGTWTPKE